MGGTKKVVILGGVLEECIAPAVWIFWWALMGGSSRVVVLLTFCSLYPLTLCV